MRAAAIGLLLLMALAASAQRPLTRAQVDDDLLLLRQALDSIHPALFRFQPQNEFEDRWRTLLRNAQEPMTDVDLYKDVQWLLASIRDSHTGMDGPPPSAEKIDVLPFLFFIREGRIFLTHNLMRGQEMPRGSELLEINGLAVSEITNLFLGLVPCDGFNHDACRYREIQRPAFFDVNMAVWFTLPSKLFLKFRPYGSDEVKTIKTWPITMAQRKKLYEKRYGPPPTAADEWQLEIDTATKTAYLKLGSFRTWDNGFDFRAFYDSAFAAIAQSGCTNLIADIRGNRGGTTNAAVEFVRWIAPRPFRWNSARYTRGKQWKALEPHLATYAPDFLNLPDSVFFPDSSGMWRIEAPNDRFTKLIEPQPNAFRGRVYLLVDEANSSAATSMAAVCHYNEFAELVGQPTAGLVEGPAAGITFYLTLPNSGIHVKIPAILNINHIPNPPIGVGVRPKWLVSTTVADQILGNDPVLSLTKKLIARY